MNESKELRVYGCIIAAVVIVNLVFWGVILFVAVGLGRWLWMQG